MLFSSIVLTGCASLSPEQCRVADWKALGEKDGYQGREEQLARHVKSCAPIGVTPSTELYRQGYHAGLKVYCQPQHILDQALAGNGRVDVCPIQQQAMLLSYYRAGHAVYESSAEVDRLVQEQDRLERELTEHKTTDQRRAEIRKKLRELDDSLRRARQAREGAENNLRRYKAR